MDEEKQEAPSKLTEGQHEQGHAVHECVPQAALLDMQWTRVDSCPSLGGKADLQTSAFVHRAHAAISGMRLSAEVVVGASYWREAGGTGAA